MEIDITLAKTFRIPLLVVLGIAMYLFLITHKQDALGMIVVVATILLGSYQLLRDTFQDLLQKHFALDYLAILAIVVSLITHEYLVAAVIALMITSGRTLEEYGATQAKASLTKLIDRIPDDVLLWKNKEQGEKVKLAEIIIGQEVYIRTGEVIPLDGVLVSETGLTDESSLTGEPYDIEKISGDPIRSGTINIGNPIVVKVTKAEKDSTYRKIITMVQNAQGEKAPLVRLADRYSTIFTIVSLLIAGFAYVLSHDLTRVLSVLVIATPCPLILATPIALLGGVNAGSKKRIIIKRLAALEALSRVNTIIFDKTGTITIGKPTVVRFEDTSGEKDDNILAVAESIERNSLHPLAKAIVQFAKEQNASLLHATNIKEEIGRGITGTVQKKTYQLSRLENQDGMTIGLFSEKKLIATFHFADEIKRDAIETIRHLKDMGLSLFIFTGDRKKAAQEVAKQLGTDVSIKAECTPQDKKTGIQTMKQEGKIVAMVGDGINDAPALALADVGIVFANEEQTAASEAADIVVLGGDFNQVLDVMHIAKKTISIALLSIFIGIGMSIGGMLFASVGLIPPLIGALLQEGIDVIAILNALRTTRIS